MPFWFLYDIKILLIFSFFPFSVDIAGILCIIGRVLLILFIQILHIHV